MGQKRTYKQYSKDYKEEAVALVREQGYSVPEAAKSLGIASNMLYRWKEQIESQLEGKSLLGKRSLKHVLALFDRLCFFNIPWQQSFYFFYGFGIR